MKKKEISLFEDLTDGEHENFCLTEVNGRVVICADLGSGDEDDEDLLPLYARLSEKEAKAIKKEIDADDADEDDEDEEDDEDAPRSGSKHTEKRWKP